MTTMTGTLIAEDGAEIHVTNIPDWVWMKKYEQLKSEFIAFGVDQELDDQLFAIEKYLMAKGLIKPSFYSED